MSVSEWSYNDVSSFLEKQGLGEYSDEFTRNKINGRALVLLKDSHLKELGVKKVGHRLRLLKNISNLRLRGSSPQSSRNVPPPSPPASSSHQPAQRSTPSATQRASPAQRSTPSATQRPSPKPDPKPVNPERTELDEIGGYTAPKRAPPQLSSGRAAASKPSATSKPAPKPAASKPSAAKQQMRTSVRRAPPPPPDNGGDDDRVPCAYCGRRFASDRLEKHEEICRRTSSKKTKVFDSAAHRLQGTEAAQFARRPSKEPKIEKTVNGVPKYKLEHEKLVASMRAARKLQAYEKAKEEGRAVGPPPEIPKYEIENDDRIECPHCHRKFGEEQARRHIPNCQGVTAGRRMPTRGSRR